MTQHRTTEWTPQALELFAAFAPHREPYRPLGTRCRGCHAAPLPPLNRRKSP